MLFNSSIFILFLAVTLAAYYLLPKKGTKYLLLAASYFFYGWWDWRFLGLIAASTVIDYFTAIGLGRSHFPRTRKHLLLISIAFNLSMLGVFKYFNFFADTLHTTLASFGLSISPAHLNVILPVGISFYTFQTMGYTIDVYRRNLQPEKHFISFATYVAFFPQLVAGPIERASHLLPQIREKRVVDKAGIYEGLWLMLWGYFLKIFMADNLSLIVDSIYSSSQAISGIDLIICHYAFAFQIFGDFAGYSYIAIGVAKLFGVNLNENFLFPYFVKTPSEFWRNWHISLSSWLRDYLYRPLGGNRVGTSLIYRNLMLTMILGGLWHGAAWHYVLWGVYQGLILVLFRLIPAGKGVSSARPVQIIRIFIMFNLTCLGWMIFRTPDLTTLANMINESFTSVVSHPAKTLYWSENTLFFIGLPFIIHLMQYLRKRPHVIPADNIYYKISICIILIYALLMYGNWSAKNFIYFQF